MEQTKRSAVTNVTANGTFDGQYGTLYKFEVTFANGEKQVSVVPVTFTI